MMKQNICGVRAFLAFVLAAGGMSSTDISAASLDFKITDLQTNMLPCRIHLADDSGKSHFAKQLPSWNDHFVCDGSASVSLPAGKYLWQIERGPEYARAVGTIDLTDSERKQVSVTLNRLTNLRKDGWFSGDLHVHRPVNDIKALMRAEDLDFAPVIEWWNKPAKSVKPAEQIDYRFDGHRVYTRFAGEDEREGGALLYFGLNRPLDLDARSREYPSPFYYLHQARELDARVWVDIEKPFWWDAPTWIASGQMNSIGLANNHMCRSEMYENEAWGRARDSERLPVPRGNGYWTQEIYYHILNTGIRIPPSAGSASGVLRNPVGYNRVYVHLGDKPLTRENWFDGLKMGRCFVTNGPLLRATANHQLPGTVFRLDAAGSKTLELEIEIASNDPLSAIDIVVNGEIVKRLPLSDGQSHIHTSINLNRPGWFLLRAIADVDETFRFASTAPWYVESKTGDRFVSQPSAQFFVDWVDERIKRVQSNVTNINEIRSVIEPHEKARQFWLDRVNRATKQASNASK